MELTELARDLVSIPSYVDSDTDESELGEYIYKYLCELGRFQVEKQMVEGKRFNVIAHDGSPPKLIFCCHMDTVPPSGSWEHDPFGGEIVEDRLFGLGASDMKGGTASLLHALGSFERTNGLFLLFDVDEEYYFKGISKFLAEYQPEHKLQPELAVFPEPGFDIKNGHRGLIEISCRVRGITGHASRPQLGKNAILGATHAVESLIVWLRQFSNPELGETSCNLAFLRGGVDRGEDERGNLIVEERANKIPDIAEVVLDIRPAASELRAQNVIDALASFLSNEGFRIDQPQIRLDYGSLLIPKDRLANFEKSVQGVLGTVSYADISNYGYGEGQLLNEKLGINCVYFGPGPSEMGHKVDEYVSVSQLKQTREVYRTLIEQYCTR